MSRAVRRLLCRTACLLCAVVLGGCTYVADEFGFLDRPAPQARPEAVGVPDAAAGQR